VVLLLGDFREGEALLGEAALRGEAAFFGDTPALLGLATTAAVEVDFRVLVVVVELVFGFFAAVAFFGLALTERFLFVPEAFFSFVEDEDFGAEAPFDDDLFFGLVAFFVFFSAFSFFGFRYFPLV